MAKGSKAASHRGAKSDQERQFPEPKSHDIANRGIRSSRDFRDMMSALMSDVISGAVTASVTNAACNAGGKMLKMVELEYKYATHPERPNRTLTVAFEEPAQIPSAPPAQLQAVTA